MGLVDYLIIIIFGEPRCHVIFMSSTGLLARPRHPHRPQIYPLSLEEDDEECRGSRDSYLYQNDELNYRIDFKCFVGLEFSNFNLKIISQPPYVC